MNPSPNLSGAPGVPNRPLTPILIPVGLLLCMIALIAWSAWPVIRPSRSIEVTQALVGSSITSDVTEVLAQDAAVSPRSTRTVQAAGWLEAEPYYIAATALADGVVEEVFFLEGDRVEQGQVLLTMVDDDARLVLARSEADRLLAEATVDLERARFEAAEQNWAEPFALRGQVEVREAQLAQLTAELEQLPAIIRTEHALVTKAQEELDNLRAAYEADAASEVEYIAARELLNAQQARLDAVSARRAILEASLARVRAELRSARSALDLRIEDRERLESARARLAQAVAETGHQQALEDEARLRLERMTIRAPISGFVQRRLKSPGDKVMLGMDAEHSAHIAHIYDPEKLQVRVDVPLADASQVYVGQACEVVVEVLPDRTFLGEVVIVTHEADLQKNTLQVKVRVIDPDPILRPEMLTRVKFHPDEGGGAGARVAGGEDSGTVRIPSGSIDSSQAEPRVWAVTDRANGRGVLRSMTIDIVSQREGWATVRADLQPGAMLAADPGGCSAGERVRVASSEGGER